MASRKYDREFKIEAVRLAQEEGSTAKDLEQRLGIGQGLISRWKRELSQNAEKAFPGKGHLPPQEEELRAVKRELGRVTRERDILKNCCVAPRRWWFRNSGFRQASATLSGEERPVAFWSSRPR